MLEAIKAACHNSVTIAWAYAKFAVGLSITMGPFVAGLISDPDFKQQLLTYIPPQHDGLALMVIATITYFARMRTIT